MYDVDTRRNAVALITQGRDPRRPTGRLGLPQPTAGLRASHPALEPWQQEIVDAYPWEFIRGLVHSDGCRITNWTVRMVAGRRKRYEDTYVGQKY
jgi:hypothetical protein